VDLVKGERKDDVMHEQPARFTGSHYPPDLLLPEAG
jgi:hypothetical protein